MDGRSKGSRIVHTRAMHSGLRRRLPLLHGSKSKRARAGNRPPLGDTRRSPRVRVTRRARAAAAGGEVSTTTTARCTCILILIPVPHQRKGEHTARLGGYDLPGP